MKKFKNKWVVRGCVTLIVLVVLGFVSRDFLEEFSLLTKEVFSGMAFGYYLQNMGRAIQWHPVQFAILGFSILFAILFVPVKKQLLKIRFRIIFGVWPKDEEARFFVDQELRKRGKTFNRFCADETSIRHLDFKIIDPLMLLRTVKRIVHLSKKEYWTAHNLAKKFGLQVPKSVKKHGV